MLFFVHNQLHMSPKDISLVYTVKMFMAYERKLKMWVDCLGEIGLDKEEIGNIILSAEIPKHWKKSK